MVHVSVGVAQGVLAGIRLVASLGPVLTGPRVRECGGDFPRRRTSSNRFSG